jgi:hypothetical protein
MGCLQSNKELACVSLEELGLDTALTPLERSSRAPFALGVEYIQTGLAAAHAETGLHWAKRGSRPLVGER